MISFRNTLLLFYACLILGQVMENVISECDDSRISVDYLGGAMDMIIKAKDHYPVCSPNVPLKAMDCEELLNVGGHDNSGVYTIWPKNRVIGDRPVKVFCDMDTEGGGWTVVQRRGNFSRTKDYFFQDWQAYKTGFGDIERDFWLGNDNIFALTNQKLYSIRFDLRDFKGETRYALYDTFWIDDENNNYTLHINDYSGDAGDSMKYHNNMKFSTKDRKNDNSTASTCAEKYQGAWWYGSCYMSNLNGPYQNGSHGISGGVDWIEWKGGSESLAATEMKIRSKNFK